MRDATPASEFVTDTMGLILRLEQRRMGPQAKAIFEAAETGQATVHIPTFVLAEILYLSEKNRIQISLHSVTNHLAQFSRYKVYPMSLEVIQSAADITDIPELHDRLIAATARLLNFELVTNDPAIQASTFVKTVW